MLGEGVVDVAVLREAAKLVIGRSGARAVQTSAGNKDLKDDQEVWSPHQIVGESNALICSKHGCVMEVNRWTVTEATGQNGALALLCVAYQGNRQFIATE